MENIVMDTSEKRPLSPPSSFDDAAMGQKLSPRKVCMIWDLAMSAYCHIFIVDLNSREQNSRADTNAIDGSIPLLPWRLLKRKRCLDMAFCVLDTTLYMFDGRQKSVFKFDLSSSENYSALPSNFELDTSELPGVELDTSKLPRASDMNHTKTAPYATPTPDGKILVFSSVITFVDAAKKQVDFELYAPSADSWQKLPGLFFDARKYTNRRFYITAFTFVNKSTIFLETNVGMFALDLKSLYKGWVKWDSFFGAAYVPLKGGPFFVIEDEICLTPSCAYDIKTQKGSSWWYSHPTPSNDATADAITLLDDDNGEYNFCTLKSVISEGIYPQLVITVYKCDLIKYRADKQKKEDFQPPSIDIVKCFKFLVNTLPSELFVPLYFSAIKAGTN